MQPRDRGRVDALKAQLAPGASMFRAMREKLGLTQVQAALRLQTSQANVSKMEKRPTADLSQIQKLAGDDYEVVVVLRPKHHKEKELEFAV
ncbi:hypothetical protein A0J57_14005 [Sphingobium sp. 22B]|nr:hypothetical protein AXW74_15105 [Sphingobium sp. AM]KYC31732.1 hypothetical protein A0J57_14005 [Sphingobium sp. 22B]OAP31054.1 hypothetical protein A8O16_15390 [Sphingobium sp. 20006FA]